jgi:hypothetical protein
MPRGPRGDAAACAKVLVRAIIYLFADRRRLVSMRVSPTRPVL